MSPQILTDAERAQLTVAPLSLAAVRAIHDQALAELRADPALGGLFAVLMSATHGQEEAAIAALYAVAPEKRRAFLRTLRATFQILSTGAPLPRLAGPSVTVGRPTLDDLVRAPHPLSETTTPSTI